MSSAQEDMLCFYHDAFGQLTNDTCVDWMIKTKVPVRRGEEYLLSVDQPELGLNTLMGRSGGGGPLAILPSW